MQQSYAKVSGVVENVPPTELVEDALRMNAAALERHGVEIRARIRRRNPRRHRRETQGLANIGEPDSQRQICLRRFCRVLPNKCGSAWPMEMDESKFASRTMGWAFRRKT